MWYNQQALIVTEKQFQMDTVSRKNNWLKERFDYCDFSFILVATPLTSVELHQEWISPLFYWETFYLLVVILIHSDTHYMSSI